MVKGCSYEESQHLGFVVVKHNVSMHSVHAPSHRPKPYTQRPRQQEARSPQRSSVHTQHRVAIADACMYARMHACVHACMRACMHACIYNYVTTHSFRYYLTSLYTYVYIYICTSIEIDMSLHISMYMLSGWAVRDATCWPCCLGLRAWPSLQPAVP